MLFLGLLYSNSLQWRLERRINSLSSGSGYSLMFRMSLSSGSGESLVFRLWERWWDPSLLGLTGVSKGGEACQLYLFVNILHCLFL